MSLLSALTAAIISLWSLRDPGACVSFTEKQAYAPKQCKALQGYADANTHLLLVGQTCGTVVKSWISTVTISIQCILPILRMVMQHFIGVLNYQ